MIIKEIELNNFRIYYGNNKIDLSTNDNKNIVIVSGDNGFGKTTFLMSLVWCLYGKQMENVDEMYKTEIDNKGGYSKYIANSLNKQAKKEGISQFSVAVTFSDITEFECNSLKIIRTYDINSGKGDDLVLQFDERPTDQLFSHIKEERLKEAEQFIREQILPIEMAKFFFFDAEKMVAYSHIDTKDDRERLASAYAQVLGIQKYEKLREELNFLLDECTKLGASGDDKRSFIEIEAAISRLSLEKEEKEQEKQTVNSDYIANKHDLEELNEALYHVDDETSAAKLQGLKKEEESLQEAIRNNQDELKDLYRYIPFAMSGELLSQMLEQVEKEITFKNKLQQNAGVDNKIEDVLCDLDKESQTASLIIDRKIRKYYEEVLERLIKKHFYTNYEENGFSEDDELHKMSNNQLEELKKLISNVKSSKDNFEYIYEKYCSNKRALSSVTRKIKEASSKAESKLNESLKNQKIELENTVNNLLIKQANLEQEIKTVCEDIVQYTKQKSNLQKKIDIEDQYKPKSELIKQLINYINEFLILFKAEKKHSLEKRILEKLQDYMHKEGFIDKVNVSLVSNCVDITLLDKDGNQIDTAGFSRGESQIFSTALLGSLVEETDLRFPVFIDSPLQKFDRNHTKNILEKFYPYVSKQVVIFPLLEKELTQQEYEYIKPYVNKVHKIMNNVQTGSSFKQLDDVNALFSEI